MESEQASLIEIEDRMVVGRGHRGEKMRRRRSKVQASSFKMNKFQGSNTVLTMTNCIVFFKVKSRS